MVVGLLRIEIHIPAALSLKDKRSVIKSVKDQLRGRFNIAVAEVDPNEKWQRASLGIVTVGDSRRSAEGGLRQALDWIQESRLVDLIRVEQEFF